MPRGRSLFIVDVRDQLEGGAPTALEVGAKTCKSGDAFHRGLLHLGSTLAEHGLRRVVAPGARPSLLDGVDAARGWALDTVDLGTVTRERRRCFDALSSVAEKTWQAVSVAATQGPRGPHTVLDEHAATIVERYTLLSAHYAASAVVLLLDGVSQPALLGRLVEQVAGARAYQGTGLGAARDAAFRSRAVEQAQWESERLGRADHSETLIAMQAFHEYLGVRWKTLYDAERAYIEQFVDWALPEKASRAST